MGTYETKFKLKLVERYLAEKAARSYLHGVGQCQRRRFAPGSVEQAAPRHHAQNWTEHLTPAGMSLLGLGRSSRTRKVPLAESTTLSMIETVAV